MVKLTYIDACNSTSLMINGEISNKIETKKLQDVCKKLINLEEDKEILKKFIIDILINKGKYEELGTCKDCGKLITEYNLDLQNP